MAAVTQSPKSGPSTKANQQQRQEAPPAPDVLVHMNDRERNKESKFVNNFIKTAKYNIVTFFPMNLFEQFCKVSNFYFLINMIFALIPGVSPVNPASAVLPLIFVIGVALIKEGYEDYVRHAADNRANSIEASVLRPSPDGRSWQLVKVASKDLHVGDVVRISTGEEVRADVVLLSTTEPEGAAFIDTCNLDGETNLKNRKAPQATWHLNSEQSIAAAKVSLKTTAPNPGLLHWGGVLRIDGREVAVGIDQFLYRSSILRNTAHAWGMIAYAGVDTKMFQNLAEKPRKFSSLDMKLNRVILAVLVVQQLVLTLLGVGAVLFTRQNAETHWYVRYHLERQSGFTLWGYRYLTYFILMSFMVPISLFVTIELCKVAQAKLMEYDTEMCEWMHGKWVNCKANTSNLNEQLSQVRFIFSDKTGTLTENVMNFHEGDILGLPVTGSDWSVSQAHLASEDADVQQRAVAYFTALCLCHTIQPFPHPDSDPGPHDTPLYEGASPDEAALVKAAAANGFVLRERTVRSISADMMGVRCTFEIMATLEFTPDRKMMSVIVREPPEMGGKIVMYTKGADSFVLPRTASTPEHRNKAVWPATEHRLREMANVGLRTLLVCSKELTEPEFLEWHARFEEAGKVLVNRSAAVDEVCLDIEDDMTIIGVTAIEDKLQDQVPETIRFFLSAGVVVWMLTGDKRETAVTIAATSSLVDPHVDNVVHIDVESSPRPSETCHDQLRVAWESCMQGRGTDPTHRGTCIVIDGVALQYAMEEHADLFLDVSQMVRSAVCCRLTPLQKANVVKMFQQATGATALAIGDGANDVSMIQEGRVGVGIVGLEGAQAALAADYAIPRFKHLRRLCCVHGRYALVRNALCVHFSFYKNLTLSVTQLIYAFYCGFSGQTMYDGWLLSFFNFAFSSLPPLTVGCFEKDIDEEPLMNDPALYAPLRDGQYFNPTTIAMWFAQAFLHAVLLYYLTDETRHEADLYHRQIETVQMGTLLMTSVVVMVLVKLMLHIKYWVVTHVVGFAISIIGYFLFLVAYSAIPNLFGYTHFHFSAYELFGEGKVWLYLLLFVAGIVGVFDLGVMFAQRTEHPSTRDTAQLKHATVVQLRNAVDLSFGAIRKRLRAPF